MLTALLRLIIADLHFSTVIYEDNQCSTVFSQLSFEDASLKAARSPQLISGCLRVQTDVWLTEGYGVSLVITISLRPVGRNWGTISFASTLYLCPILDLLLAEIPVKLQAELRLGLQEALVNAAKHGNHLDPGKTVVVRFSLIDNQYWWIISDQGSGFSPCCTCDRDPTDYLPPDESENGRGMTLLHHIFDQVEWNRKGTELRLCKQLDNRPRLSLRR